MLTSAQRSELLDLISEANSLCEHLEESQAYPLLSSPGRAALNILVNNHIFDLYWGDRHFRKSRF